MISVSVEMISGSELADVPSTKVSFIAYPSVGDKIEGGTLGSQGETY